MAYFVEKFRTETLSASQERVMNEPTFFRRYVNLKVAWGAFFKN